MTFLTDVVAQVSRSVQRPGYLHGLPKSPAHRPPGFRKAIEAARTAGALIVEYKRVSPGASEPVLPTRSIAGFLESVRGGAPAAYSCLATGPRFRGSPQDVAELSSRTDRPVLFKDFIIDPIQIEAAHRAGASAILLIARIELDHLATHSLSELAENARARGLEVLLEFHTESELVLGPSVRPDVYGVNARDLRNLEMRPETARATMRAAAALRPLLGLSGVQSPAEANEFWRAGADGLLVGSAVAWAKDPSTFLRTLYRPMSGSVP